MATISYVSIVPYQEKSILLNTLQKPCLTGYKKTLSLDYRSYKKLSEKKKNETELAPYKAHMDPMGKMTWYAGATDCNEEMQCAWKCLFWL